MQEITKNVHDALNGDKKGFEELYRATSKAVYFTCLSLVKNGTDAEDLMQDAYIAAFEKLPSLSEPEKFAAWVKRIAVNKCNDFLAKKGAHPEYPTDGEGAAEEPVGENILPEEYAENREKRRIVMDIMKKSLSDAQYRTVIMFYFDEMSVAEIAEAMDCPEGTVKYRLNAARSKIKKGVLNYENRTDDKLYAFAGAPFLARLLAAESAELTVPALKIASLIPAAAQAASSAAGASGAGAKAFLGTLKGKLIVGAAAVAVCGAAAAAAVTAGSPGAQDSTDDSYISESFSVSYTSDSPDDTDGMDDDFSLPAANDSSEDNDLLSSGDYLYEDIPGGVRIIQYLGNEEYLTVPAEIDGKRVLEIDDDDKVGFVFYDFERSAAIKEITLPEGLERIGKSVFSFLSELKAVHFPESLESLGPFAFLNCSSLEGIALPDCEIDFYALFEDCISLKEITLPEGPTELFSTLQGCSALESITVPASVETLDCTFMECTSLKTVTFKENSALTSIGLSTFEDCSALESITVPDGVKEIYNDAFKYCFSLKSVTLPDSLEDIGRSAFYCCTSLEEIVLPDGIRYIHPTAFEGCSNTRIIFKGKSYTAEEISELKELNEP